MANYTECIIRISFPETGHPIVTEKRRRIMKHACTLCLLLSLLLGGCASAPQYHDEATAELTILTEEYFPLNFMEGGAISGQATEVVRELMVRTGTAGEIRMVPWEEGYRAVLVEANTALFSTTMTQKRKERQLQWVGPITVLDTNLYAVRGAGIRIGTLEEARGVRRIATVADYYSEQVLEQEGFTNLKSHANEKDAVQSLLRGEARLLVGNNTTLPAVLEKQGVGMDAVESVFTVSTDLTYIAFSRATPPERVARWQEALDAMKRDGRFSEIYTGWLPDETPPGIVQLVTEEYPPITFMRDGKPAGIVTDMVREIAQRNAIPDNVRLTTWKNAYNMTLLHPNVVLFSADRTPEREELFHWVGPVGRNSAILFAKKGSGIRIASLQEAREVGAIATTTDWFTEQHLKREGFTNLVSSKDPVDNVKQLMNGEVQLSIFTNLTIPEIVKDAGYSMEDLAPVYTVSHSDFYIAISKGTPAGIVKQWRDTLNELKRDGTFEEIYRSYLPKAELGDLLAQ
jgi:polar amino acid transport system substrate-binding protein